MIMLRIIPALIVLLVIFGCQNSQRSENNLSENFTSPKMIDIQSGEFLMGCVSGENCKENEFPIHRVTVKAFKLGETEVTFGLWDTCVDDGACSHKPDHKWVPNKNTDLRENLPVMLVSFIDITEEFIPWLNNKTGMRFRLPTESEWEYAARAGSETSFNTGMCLHTDHANYDGFLPSKNCPQGEHKNKAMPVKSYSPNAFGLYDMHGNVWEWVQDCWNNSDLQIPHKGNYIHATNDGSANFQGDCSLRIIRGGAWNTGAEYSRSAYRDWYYEGLRYYSKGFRLAMTM